MKTTSRTMSPDQILGANLNALPTAVRRVVESTDPSSVDVDFTAAVPSAHVRTPSGQRVPVHSGSDPVAEFEQLLSRISEREAPPLLIVIGLGLGYLLDAIERRAMPTRVLAIEPVPALTRAMLARRDWRPWLGTGRLTVLAGPEYAGAQDAWRVFTKGATTASVIVAPMLDREFRAAAEHARTLAKQIVVGVRSNEEARRQFAGRYLLNTLTNLPVIASEGDAASLFDAFQGIPAIVVGAGPSLDRLIPDLRPLEKRALIIAVDTAARPLIAAGIRPHFVVGVDPSELNARHLDALPDVRGMWFVAEGSLHPTVFPQFAGRTFTFRVSNHHPWPWLAQHGAGRGKLQAWGSVLTTAFDFAIRAGCDPIVFAGADLSYTNGLLYCRNTVYEREWAHLRTNEERARAFERDYFPQRSTSLQTGINGKTVRCEPRFLQFRDWIVARANAAADRTIINGTGVGMLEGGRIVQRGLRYLSLPDTGELELRERIFELWNRSANQRRESSRRLCRSLRSDGLTLRDWLDFGGDTATAEQIGAAVEEAANTVARSEEQLAYLDLQRTYYLEAVQSGEDARRISHGDYERGMLQAGAQQAHVLLDMLQRTYSLEGNPTIVEVVRAASSIVPRRALDFGCGIGRSMEPLVEIGWRVDGVDISERMLHFARENPKLQGCEFFVSSGTDCGAAPDASYDLVYSQLTFRTIALRSVRRRILQAMARALRPGGVVVVQMRFSPDLAAANVPDNCTSWSRDAVASSGDVSPKAAEMLVTPEELHLVYADFVQFFFDIRLQVVDLAPTAREARPAQLLVSGTASRELARRMHAQAKRGESI